MREVNKVEFVRKAQVMTLSGEETHAIYTSETLRRRKAELHRFINSAGEGYSAIYVDGMEQYSAERAGEKAMINHFLKGE